MVPHVGIRREGSGASPRFEGRAERGSFCATGVRRRRPGVSGQPASLQPRRSGRGTEASGRGSWGGGYVSSTRIFMGGWEAPACLLRKSPGGGAAPRRQPRANFGRRPLVPTTAIATPEGPGAGGGRRAQAQTTVPVSVSVSPSRPGARRVGGASAVARKAAGVARERPAASRGAPAPLPGGRCGEGPGDAGVCVCVCWALRPVQRKSRLLPPSRASSDPGVPRGAMGRAVGKGGPSLGGPRRGCLGRVSGLAKDSSSFRAWLFLPLLPG